MPIVTKFVRELIHCEKLPFLKPHDPLITSSCDLDFLLYDS